MKLTRKKMALTAAGVTGFMFMTVIGYFNADTVAAALTGTDAGDQGITETTDTNPCLNGCAGCTLCAAAGVTLEITPAELTLAASGS